MVVQCFKKAGISLLLGAAILSAGSCSTIQPKKADSQSDKVNKRIDKKHDNQNQQAREEFLQKHYERQAASVQKRMDHNAREAEQWRQQYLVDDTPSLFEQIGEWFQGLLEWLDRPDQNLFR